MPSSIHPDSASSLDARASVRPASMQDVDALCEMYQEVIAELEKRKNYPLWHWGIYPNEETVRDAIERGEMVILAIDGKLAGAAKVNEELEGEEYVLWKGTSPRSIHLFTIRPGFTGMHASDWFLMRLIKEKRSSHIDSLRLNLIVGNKPAKNLYLRCGFVSCGCADVLLEDEGVLPFELMEYIYE